MLLAHLEPETPHGLARNRAGFAPPSAKITAVRLGVDAYVVNHDTLIPRITYQQVEPLPRMRNASIHKNLNFCRRISSRYRLKLSAQVHQRAWWCTPPYGRFPALRRQQGLEFSSGSSAIPPPMSNSKQKHVRKLRTLPQKNNHNIQPVACLRRTNGFSKSWEVSRFEPGISSAIRRGVGFNGFLA